jgi:agmatine/peptidylarginine deiminase
MQFIDAKSLRQSIILRVLLLCLPLLTAWGTVVAQNRDFQAEYEKHEGILLTWDYTPSRDSVTANIAKAVQDVAIVWIIYYPGPVPYDTGYIRAYLLSRGVGYHNVHFIPAWTETLWIRDYGPFSGYRYTGEDWQRFFLDGQYSKYGRPKDDSIPAQLGRYWGIPVAPFPVEIEGGNVILDGTGVGFGSKRIWQQNPALSPTQIEELFKTQFGLQAFHFIDVLQNSGGGIWMHVDMFMKVTDNQTLLVSQYPDYLPDFQLVENIAQMLSQTPNGLGVNYNIVRIPAPPKEDGTYATTMNDEMRTYTNSLTINGVVVVPSYNHPLDATAKAIYEATMPGYQIKMVDARTLTPLYGAIHCITKEITKPGYLRILHRQVSGGQAWEEHFEISCIIRGEALPDSQMVYYRVNNDTIFQTAPLLPRGGDNFAATITGQMPGDTIRYYISTKSLTEEVTDPPVAPAASYKFWFDDNTAIRQNAVLPKIAVVTNRGQIEIRVPAALEDRTATIAVYDLCGRMVSRNSRQFGETIRLQGLASGWYILKGTGKAGTYSQKFYVFPD